MSETNNTPKTSQETLESIKSKLTPEELTKLEKEKGKLIITKTTEAKLEELKKSLPELTGKLSDNELITLIEDKPETNKPETTENKKEIKEGLNEAVEKAKSGDLKGATETAIGTVAGAIGLNSAKDGSAKDFFTDLKEKATYWIGKFKDFFAKLISGDIEGALEVFKSKLDKGIDKLRQSKAWVEIYSKAANYLGIDDTVKNYKELLKEENFANLTIAQLKKYYEKPEYLAIDAKLKSSVEKTKNVVETFIGSPSMFDWVPGKTADHGAYGSTKDTWEKIHGSIDENTLTVKEYIEKLADC